MDKSLLINILKNQVTPALGVQNQAQWHMLLQEQRNFRHRNKQAYYERLTKIY